MSFMNGDLSRAYRRLKKKNGWDKAEETGKELQETMMRLAPVPGAMAEELADFFLEDSALEETVYRADEILELLNGTWIPEDSVLKADDWNFLEELINAWAVEMDMDVVTDVMKAVVSYGGYAEK
jgi:hypothetical protein